MGLNRGLGNWQEPKKVNFLPPLSPLLLPRPCNLLSLKTQDLRETMANSIEETADHFGVRDSESHKAHTVKVEQSAYIRTGNSSLMQAR